MGNVFIIHGHDDQMRETVKEVVNSIGLNPIILQEKSNSGSLTLIEKLEKQSNKAGYAVVLLTKDDEGRKKGTKKLENRARQNVIFEMGFFMSKLGRGKVLCLLQEGLEQPSDIKGIAYIKLDESGTWKEKLVYELERAGYDVK